MFDKGIKLSVGFDLQSPFPLDSRNKVATLSELNSLTSNDVEPGHITFCEENKKFYVFIDDDWKDFLTLINSGTLYSKTIDSALFVLNDVVGLYEYEFDNPFSSTGVICGLQDANGESLLEIITVTDTKIKVSLNDAETVVINVIGSSASEEIIDKTRVMYSESIDSSAFVLDTVSNMYEYTLVNPYNSSNVICSLQNIDGSSLVESIIATDTEIKITLSQPETVTLNVIGSNIDNAIIIKDKLSDYIQIVKDSSDNITGINLIGIKLEPAKDDNGNITDVKINNKLILTESDVSTIIDDGSNDFFDVVVI